MKQNREVSLYSTAGIKNERHEHVILLLSLGKYLQIVRGSPAFTSKRQNLSVFTDVLGASLSLEGMHR